MNTVPPERVPRLRYRLTRQDDLPECLSLLPTWLGLDAAARHALPRLWTQLVREPFAHTMVMEDLAQPRGQRVQGWGVTLLLGPADVQLLQLQGTPEPGVARRTYQALLDGRLGAHDDLALGRMNARGELSALFMHFCVRDLDFTQPYGQAVVAIANDSLRTGMNGYHLDALYFESPATDEPLLRAAGFIRRPRPAGHEASGLLWWGMTREEARKIMPGSTARALFDAHPPRFRLSLSQRRMLWLALFHDDDEELAQALSLSAHGLKKLWRGVYERIEDSVPDFFGEPGSADEEGKRGPEKRRQVLAYVRQRQEELRPWAASD